MIDFGYVDSVVHSRFQLSLASGNNASFKISVNTCEFGFNFFHDSGSGSEHKTRPCKYMDAALKHVC